MSDRGSGGVAVIAALIGIIIIAVGTAALILTGRNSISDTQNVPTAVDSVYEESSNADSESEENSEADRQDSSTAQPLMSYPEEATDYKEIDDKAFTADYGLLIDVDNNTIAAGKNYDKKMYPASLTKIMTLVIAAENIEDFEDTYTFTSNDIDPLVEEDASRAGFDPGEKVTMKDLMYASILVSGADGTVAISNAVAGSEKDFVDMMNQKAQELGLENTQFVNASGLHNKNHYSTCEDMAMLLKYALENDICREIFNASTYTTSKTSQHPDGIELTSILAMRLDGYYVEGGGDIMGGKTGFTTQAKYTLATNMIYENKEYICVTAKSTGEFAAVEDMILVYEKYVPRENADVE